MIIELFQFLRLIRKDLAHIFMESYRDPELLWRIGYFCHPLSFSLRYTYKHTKFKLRNTE